VAVHDLSFEVLRGEVFGLLGPNGAGKTTTVSMVIGLLPPDRGAVELEGLGSPSDPRVRQRIGVAPQSLALYDELTGRQNLEFFGRMQGLAGAPLAERVQRALAFVDLTDRARDRVGAYSGGMKRRLNLAAALVHDPLVIVLDEPTAGVDPQSRNALFENIDALKREGRTIIYTTHYMEEAERLCDRVGIMDHGRLLALSTVEGLIGEHGGRTTVIVERDGIEERHETEDPIATLTEMGRAGAYTRVRIERPNLEAVFLHLTGRRLRD
jgi:ABC-2 type transport system ATP-binding protein